MALKLKYTDEHGILHINMSPTASNGSPRLNAQPSTETEASERTEVSDKTELSDPKFDTINNRFSNYDLFGGKYDIAQDGGEVRSLFRSRYNSIEEELANTPYAFTHERTRTLRFTGSPILDITIKSSIESPSKDLEDDRFFNRDVDLFGPQIDFETSIKTSDEDSPAFTVTQLIHAQDRYFDLSGRTESPRTESKTVVEHTLTSKAKDIQNNNRTVKSVSNFKVKSEPNSAKDRVKIDSFRGKVTEKPSTGVNRELRSVRSELKSVRSELKGAKSELRGGNVKKDEAFKVLCRSTPQSPARSPLRPSLKSPLRSPSRSPESVPVSSPVVPTTPKRRREKSFAILTEVASRPASPRSLPVDINRDQRDRISPFRGRGFREETSRHTTPKTSTTNSRSTSPRRRTSSLSRIDKMATAALPPPLPSVHNLSRPHSPRNFLKQNIEEVRELSELNREKHEAEAEQKRLEEETALLKEMGLLDKNAKSDAIRSVVVSRNASRVNSRSNSPNKTNLRSRSNSPGAKVLPSAILHFENISADSEFINGDNDTPVTHKSRGRSVSRSQPESNDGSAKHSKIPKRQNSVSPVRKQDLPKSKTLENNLTKNQRFISNSTSSIHETIRIGSQSHDKRNISKSTLNIAPAHIKGKPPISPNRGGPPPSNKSINAKRLSPIVGTPNKSPIEDKPNSARTPTKSSPAARKPVKTAGNTPAISRLNSRQPSKNVSRDPSPDKRRTAARNTTTKPVSKPITRAGSTKPAQKPTEPKPEPKKPINRTSSMKSLTRTPSTKTLYEKPPILKKRDSKKDLKAQSTSKIDEVGKRESAKNERKSPVKEKPKARDVPISAKPKANKADKDKINGETKKTTESAVGIDEVSTQDNETQYDKVTNEKGDLVILTKKNVVSMTTAAITSQPLEVVTKVTNQLPTVLEKAREKAVFERNSSKDSLAPKEDDREGTKTEDKNEEENSDVKKTKSQASSSKTSTTYFSEENVKLRPLLPPYNNPQVEKVKQKIDDILKAPVVSTECILNTPTPPPKLKSFKNIADKAKNDIKDSKEETTNKFMDLKNQMEKQKEKTSEDIRTEATKIVDSIITPVEEPKEVVEKIKEEVKKEIEPIVMVVNEKTSPNKAAEVIEKVTETLVKGEPEVEVQSSNMSTPAPAAASGHNKMADSNGSGKSNLSNGGFPQSTSTTPKPPARTKKESKEDKPNDSKETTPDSTKKPPNFGQKLMGTCKKCCSCCVKPEAESDEKEKKDVEAPVEGKEAKRGFMSRLNCCKRGEKEIRDMESAAGKAASIEFESETKRKRKVRDIMCGCCGRRRRVSDIPEPPRHLADVTAPAVVGDSGCCGTKKPIERRDSILSDRPQNSCCNNRLWTWVVGACRRAPSEEPSASRRQSMFSKNKSLSPTLPPEDTRTKLDASLVEHTSVMRGAIPVLPIALAYFCLFCNVLVPGLGTIFSGMFCLCFGIPRFGVHDGAKHRIGSFFINLVVGCGQLFTVLFCLVGWGWSIWWGVIMLKISRKYRKLAAEAALEEAEAPPQNTNTNHTRA